MNEQKVPFTLNPELSAFADEELSSVSYKVENRPITLEEKLGVSYPEYLRILRVQLAYLDTYKRNFPERVHEQRRTAKMLQMEEAKKQGLPDHLINQAVTHAKQIFATFRERQSAQNIVLSRVGGKNPLVYLGDGSQSRGLGYIQGQRESKD